ncbi:hypothetical protein Tsubulata_009403, partial [Turnera subulata]
LNKQKSTTTMTSSPTESYSVLHKHEQEEEGEESFSYAMQLALGSVLPMALKTAFELPTNNPDASTMLDRILRLLVSHFVLACSLNSNEATHGTLQTRLYSLLPVAKFFVPDDDGASLGPVPTLVQGKEEPHSTGVEHVTSDRFESVPHGQTMLMKRILHKWSDEDCLRLLKNCHKALPSDAKLIVMEAVVPIMRTTSITDRDIGHIDVFTMAQDPGGKERTRQEFVGLAKGAGFKGVKFVCTVYSFGVMEFYK